MTIVTTSDCHIESYLRHVGARFEVVAAITDSSEYKAIEAYYGERVAARSGVPLMHHIDEGLQVLAKRNASTRAMKAFSLHPLVQEDTALNGRPASTDDVAALDRFPFTLPYQIRPG